MSKFEGKNFDLRLLAYAMQYHLLTTAALAEGTNAGTWKTVGAAITFLNKGKIIASAAADNEYFSTGHTTLNKDSDTAEKCKFLVMVAADGTTFSTSQGPIVAAAADDPGAGPVTNALTPIGTILVETNAATPFVPTTAAGVPADGTDLGDGGITDTFENLAWPYDGEDGLDITALAN
jgi:hypothetical protein